MVGPCGSGKEVQMINLQVECRMCNSEHVITVSKEAYEKHKNGAHVQDAFPTLNANQRELLISGTCPTCWDKIFGE